MSWWADVTSDDSTDALAAEEKVAVEETSDLISFIRSTDGESRLQLSLNENVLNNLIDSCQGKPICVISAVGPCRSGKSLLLNCIKEKISPPNHNSKAPQPPAFKVNHDYNPCTKGIRVNSEAIIVDGDQGEVAVILMDTAGLDEELLSDDKDGVLLGLPLFLSSILIYNIKGSPNDAPFELLSRLLPDANSDLGFQKLSLLFRDWVRIKEYPFGLNGGKRFLDSKRRQNKPEFMAVYNAFAQKDCCLLPHIGEKHLQRKLSNVDKDTEMTFKRFLAQYLTELLDTSNIQAKEIYNNPLKPEDFRLYAKKYVDYFNDPTEMQLGINPESLLEITKDTTAQIILSASSAEYHTRFQQRRLDTPMRFLSNAALDRFDSLAKRTAKSVLDKYTLPSETKRELQQNFDKKIYAEFRKIKQENQAKWRQAKDTVLDESCAELRASLAAKFPFQKNALPQSAGDLMFYDDNDLNTVITNTKYVIMTKFHDEFDNEEHQDIPALKEELEEKLGDIEKEYVSRNTENRERAEKKATHLTHTCLNGYKAAMKARLDQNPNMDSHFLEVFHIMELERVKKELANLNFGAGGFRKNEEQDVLRAIYAEFKEMQLNLDSRKAEAKNLVETYANNYSKEIKAAAEAMKEPELRLLHQQRMPEVIRQFQAINPYPSSTTQNQEIKNQLEAKLQQIFINALEIIAQVIRQREGNLLKLHNNCFETAKQRLQQTQNQKDFLAEEEVGEFTVSLINTILAEFDQASHDITDDAGKTANARSSLHDKISLEIASWVTKNKNRAAVVESEADTLLESCIKEYETQMSVQVRKINTREELQEQHEALKAAAVNEFIKKSPTKKAAFNESYVQKMNKKVDEMSEEIEELFNMKKNQDDVSLMAAIVDAKNSYKHNMDTKFNNVNRYFTDSQLETLHDETLDTVVQAVCRQLSLAHDRKKKVTDRLHELFEKYKDKNKILKQSYEDTEIAIGIDLGTTYCCVAVFHMGKTKIVLNGVGANTTPSYVTLNVDGSTTVGQAAKTQSFRNPEATIFDAKRMIGRALTDERLAEDIKLWPFKVEEVDGRAVINVHGKRYPPESISAMILAHLKEDAENFLGKKVTKAVITVPAYFTDGQRQATIDAGEVAGLEVLAILNEPTAAAFAYRLEWFTGDAKTILVYDLGGGTFDVAILKIQENSIDVLSTAGDSHLGGEDFDQNMMKYCAKKFKETSGIDLFVGKDSENKKERDNARRRLNRLQQACEEQKKALAGARARNAIVAIDQIAQDEDLAVNVTRDEFDQMNAQLFQRTITIVDEALRAAKITKDRIDDIVLVGGSTRIKKVQEMLEKHFQGKALNKHINPDEAVAYGAAVQAAILNGNPGAKVLDFGHVQEVTPMSLGVELANGEMDVIIPKSTKIPYSCTQTYHTFEDNQPDVSIKIYQGEAEHVIDNVLLANYTLSGIPPAAAREEAVDITMSLDKNGILNVKAICKSTNESLQVTVSDKPGGLTKDEKRLLRGRGTS